MQGGPRENFLPHTHSRRLARAGIVEPKNASIRNNPTFFGPLIVPEHPPGLGKEDASAGSARITLSIIEQRRSENNGFRNLLEIGCEGLHAVIVRLNRRSGLYVEIFRTPGVLTGDPERAAGDLIALARESAGIQEAARSTPSRSGALSRVQGVTRLSRYEVIEVFAVPVGDDVVIAEARWRGQRSDPSAWRALKASLRAL